MQAAEANTAEEQRAIVIAPLGDSDLIERTIRHPRIFPHVKDDATCSPEAFTIAGARNTLYLGAYAGGEYIGLFMLHPHNMVCWEVHTCLLPDGWGPAAVSASKACAAWMFKNTTCRRIITTIPVTNKLAQRLAAKAGMTCFGVNEQSILKDGTLVDQVLFGMGRTI